MTIYEFNKGDEIVRVFPAKPLQNIFGVGVQDRSYMGDRMIFQGIANGQIYLERTGINKQIFGGKLLDISLDLWDEGWERWIDPESIETNNCPVSYLEEKMNLAAANEDYELAEKLRTIVEQLNNVKK